MLNIKKTKYKNITSTYGHLNSFSCFNEYTFFKFTCKLLFLFHSNYSIVVVFLSTIYICDNYIRQSHIQRNREGFFFKEKKIKVLYNMSCTLETTKTLL